MKASLVRIHAPFVVKQNDSNTMDTTESLVDQARTGKLDAFGKLCLIYEGRLFRQAMVLTGQESLARDLAQDTLVAAWKNIGRFQKHCQFNITIRHWFR